MRQFGCSYSIPTQVVFKNDGNHWNLTSSDRCEFEQSSSLNRSNILVKVKVKYTALTPSLSRRFFFPILAQILGGAHHFCRLYLTSIGL